MSIVDMEKEKTRVFNNILEDRLLNKTDNIKLFLNDIKEVCLKHKLSISHEDCHGGFIIEKFDYSNIEWLFGADVKMEDK